MLSPPNVTVDQVSQGHVRPDHFRFAGTPSHFGSGPFGDVDTGEIRRMHAISQFTVAAMIALIFASGCTTLQTMPARMKSLVSKEPDPTDPLSNVVGKPGKDYKTAKKELQAPEETMLKFARWREDLGDHSESLDRYREILRGNPDSVNARLGIARVEFKTGRVLEAEEILKATARQHPQNLAVWLEMGRIQTEREEYGEAVQSLTKAVNIDSSNQSARYQLGLALARGDRLDEAKSHLAFAVGESAALFNIGFVLHEAGRNEEATHWLQQALASHPDQRTEHSAQQMLALVRSGKTANSSASVAARKIPAKVNLQLTSYESYTENPANPALQPAAAITPRAPVSGASADVGSALPGHASSAGQAATPLLQRQPAALQRSAAPTISATRTADNRFYNHASQSTGPPPWQSRATPASFHPPVAQQPPAAPQTAPAFSSPAGHQGSVEPQPWQPGS